MDRTEFFDLIPAMPQHQRVQIQWAYALAKKWHEGQFRDNGERYFEHVRRAVIILIMYGYTEYQFIIYLLLHDILEDTTIPLSMLEQLFGPEIARGIVTVSKTYGLEDPLTGYVVHRQKRGMEEYMAGIRRHGKAAALAKCADRIDNLTDLMECQPEGSRWTPEKRLKQVAETREWIMPLALQYDERFHEKLLSQCRIIEARATSELADHKT